jgi:DNA-binding PadR family transcriptional regulator
MSPKTRGPEITDWAGEKRRLQEEYRRRLKELEASRETTEVVGQVLTRGLLPIYVLHLLGERPRNGNELCTDIRTRTEGAWQPSTGGIYPLLRRFEKQGLVAGNWQDPDKRTQRVYALTENGQVQLSSLRAAMKPRLESAFKVFEIVAGDLFATEMKTPEEGTAEQS